MKADVFRGINVKEEEEWTDGESKPLVEIYKEKENLWNHRLLSYRDGFKECGNAEASQGPPQ